MQHYTNEQRLERAPVFFTFKGGWMYFKVCNKLWFWFNESRALGTCLEEKVLRALQPRASLAWLLDCQQKQACSLSFGPPLSSAVGENGKNEYTNGTLLTIRCTQELRSLLLSRICLHRYARNIVPPLLGVLPKDMCVVISYLVYQTLGLVIHRTEEAVNASGIHVEAHIARFHCLKCGGAHLCLVRIHVPGGKSINATARYFSVLLMLRR